MLPVLTLQQRHLRDRDAQSRVEEEEGEEGLGRRNRENNTSTASRGAHFAQESKGLMIGGANHEEEERLYLRSLVVRDSRLQRPAELARGTYTG